MNVQLSKPAIGAEYVFDKSRGALVLGYSETMCYLARLQLEQSTYFIRGGAVFVLGYSKTMCYQQSLQSEQSTCATKVEVYSF